MILYTAQSFFDLGPMFKDQSLLFARFVIIGAAGLLTLWFYFAERDKTKAIKTLVIGAALAGLVTALPALGQMSTDTITHFTGGARG
jgi:RsiW-degrading membrane proteinase PrsW (M82 family)